MERCFTIHPPRSGQFAYITPEQFRHIIKLLNDEAESSEDMENVDSQWALIATLDLLLERNG